MSRFSTRTIGEVTETLIDYRGKTPPKSTRGVKLITAKVIKGGFILEGDHEYITDDVYAKWMSRGLPKQWDILITTEAPLGEVAQIRTKEKVALAQRVILLRGNPSIVDQRYYFYALQSPFAQGELRARSTGTTVLGIKQSELVQAKIPYRSLPTQRKIAAILSAYDDLIENNTQRIAILEEMARLVYREWFVQLRFPGHEGVRMVESEVGLVPEGWEVGRLDEAILLQRGFDLPGGQRQEGNVPVYAATGIVGTHNEAKVSAPGVLTGRSGSLGTIIYAEEDFWPLNTTLWVKEFRRATPLYAYYLLNGLELASFNSGAAVPTLNRNDIHGLPVVLPAQTVLKQFDDFLLPMFALRKTLQKENSNLQRTRDLLLPRLVSGEIDVSGLDIDVSE